VLLLKYTERGKVKMLFVATCTPKGGKLLPPHQKQMKFREGKDEGLYALPLEKERKEGFTVTGGKEPSSFVFVGVRDSREEGRERIDSFYYSGDV